MSAMDNAHQEPIGEENPEVPSPPPPGETILTEETQSLLNIFRSVVLTPQEKQTRSQLLVILMTTDSEEGEDASQFTEMISRLDELQLQNMVSLLTLHTNYFMKIARNKNGSQRIVNLLGQSDDGDTFFFLAIMRCFSRVMTHKQAAYVGIKGMQVFEEKKRETMYKHIVKDAIDLACDKYGCFVLNYIMTELGNINFGERLPDEIAFNALRLSNHAYGNFVVQNVLKQNDLRCTYNIASELKGHFVELSLKKYGSYIVEKLLDTEESMVMVVEELLQCEGHRLRSLARDKYGSFVVRKALRVTKEMSRFDLLRTYLGKNIVESLDSVHD